MSGRTWSLLLALAGCATAQTSAQVPASRIIEQARAQLDALDADSAASLLRYALDPRTGTGLAERLRGYTLLGIAELMRAQRSEARAAFRSALLLDPDLRVDSLAPLTSELVPTFATERGALARSQTLQVVVQVPADTVIPVQGGGYRVDALPTGTARVILTLSPAPDGPVVYADSDATFMSGLRAFAWNLRTNDGATVPPGRFVLRVTARDSSGRVAPVVERPLILEREAADTQALPPPLDSSAFQPESVTVRARTAKPLWRGLGFGVAAGLLAFAGTGPSGVKDGRAFVVGGTVALAGLTVYLTGTRERRPDPTAIERNRAVVQRDAESRAGIARANAEARARARMRVRIGSDEP